MGNVVVDADIRFRAVDWGRAMFSAAEMQTLAASKRKTAARARYFAGQLAHSADRDRLLLHAAELEAEAVDLERQARSQN